MTTRKFSPELITAVFLFLPTAGWLFYGANEDGVLSTKIALAATLLAAALMASPIAMLKLKDKPFFRQA